jgi:hypothetical protein
MNFNRRFKNPSAPSPPKRLPALVFFQPPLQIRARPTGRQSLQIRDRPRLIHDRIMRIASPASHDASAGLSKRTGFVNSEPQIWMFFGTLFK